MLYKPVPAIAAVMRASKGEARNAIWSCFGNALHQRGCAVIVLALRTAGRCAICLIRHSGHRHSGERIRYAIPGLRQLIACTNAHDRQFGIQSEFVLSCRGALASRAQRTKLVLREVSSRRWRSRTIRTFKIASRIVCCGGCTLRDRIVTLSVARATISCRIFRYPKAKSP